MKKNEEIKIKIIQELKEVLTKHNASLAISDDNLILCLFNNNQDGKYVEFDVGFELWK